MKKFLLSGLIISFSSIAIAQESGTSGYRTAAGIRLGPNSPAISPGFTIKHFLSESSAVEGIVGIGNGIGVCALYEWHHPISSVNNLQWFIGAGGYAAFRNQSSYIGAAGIAGLDYQFDNIPLNLSIDWKPELNIISKVGFESSGVGFSVRYIF